MSNANKVEWLDGTKPKKIEARYSAYLNWDLDDEGINWDDIDDYDVCRGQLYIKLNNVDYKHGLEEILILGEDWNPVEGLN